MTKQEQASLKKVLNLLLTLQKTLLQEFIILQVSKDPKAKNVGTKLKKLEESLKGLLSAQTKSDLEKAISKATLRHSEKD